MKKPYYAVIFSSEISDEDQEGYEIMAMKMISLAKDQPGYIGMESVRGVDGKGITVSYWESMDSIRAWKAHQSHLEAQALGRVKWYKSFKTKICKVEHGYEK